MWYDCKLKKVLAHCEASIYKGRVQDQELSSSGTGSLAYDVFYKGIQSHIKSNKKASKPNDHPHVSSIIYLFIYLKEMINAWVLNVFKYSNV